MEHDNREIIDLKLPTKSSVHLVLSDHSFILKKYGWRSMIFSIFQADAHLLNPEDRNSCFIWLLGSQIKLKNILSMWKCLVRVRPLTTRLMLILPILTGSSSAKTFPSPVWRMSPFACRIYALPTTKPKSFQEPFNGDNLHF